MILPSGVQPPENKAKNEPDFVTSPFDTDLEFTPYERQSYPVKGREQTDYFFVCSY